MSIIRSVAIDLGAASCRVSLGEWDARQLAGKIHYVHRYSNGPAERDGHLYWQLDGVCQAAEEGLRLAVKHLTGTDAAIHSIGVDGWAVDYVWLDKSGQPLRDPYCYRDPRTESAMPEVWARLSRQRIYELTGIQFLRFNTLYQLYADVRDGVIPAKAGSGARWLNIPEYLLYRLCGGEASAAVAEYTNATHTQLVNARTRNWSDEIFECAGLDRSAAARIVPSGTKLGPLRGEVAALAAYRNASVIAPACHDTGSAVAGIPATGDDWAFISSGTWSLVGAVLDAPCTSAAALKENFTNEGGVGGTYRFLKNVNGMWLLEECLREWQEWGGKSWTLRELIAACERQRPLASQSRACGNPNVFNVDAPELILPGGMPAKINRELENAGHAPIAPGADHAPEMAKAIFASLAARYACVLRALQEVTGRRLRRLYIVGGGSQNEYLNRLIGEQTRLEVIRGAVECSTIGNLAVQFAAIESGGAAVTPADVSRWAARFQDPVQ